MNTENLDWTEKHPPDPEEEVRMCDACGDREAKTDLLQEGDVLYLCPPCDREIRPKLEGYDYGGFK